jgi:hypothetical protein
MKFHLRFIVVLAIGLVAYGVLIRAFHLMSMPSNRDLYAGIAIVLGLLLFVPVIVHMIWRKL